MLIKIPSRSDCSESEVTSETLYLSRRRLLGASFAGLALASGLPRLGFADEQRYAGVEPVPAPGWFAEKLPQTRWQAVDVQRRRSRHSRTPPTTTISTNSGRTRATRRKTPRP